MINQDVIGYRCLSEKTLLMVYNIFQPVTEFDLSQANLIFKQHSTAQIENPYQEIDLSSGDVLFMTNMKNPVQTWCRL